MSADSERLTPNYTETGLIDMPAMAGYRHGETIQLRESMTTETATIWVNLSTDLGYASVELTLDKAAGLRDQLDVLIRQHRMAETHVDTDGGLSFPAHWKAQEPRLEDSPPPAPTWRPIRTTPEGAILAIIDEHGERLSIQPDPCPRCQAITLFKGPTRSLCASCGATS